MKGASGKFRVHNMSSQTEIIREMIKKDEANILLSIVSSNADYYSDIKKLDLSTRVEFLLKKFHLHLKDYQGVGNFDEMKEELCDIIFEPYRKNELCIEKVLFIFIY